MTTSGDPRLPSNETPRPGTFHDMAIDPSCQHQGSLTAGMHEYDPRVQCKPYLHNDPRRAPPVFPTLATDPLIVSMPYRRRRNPEPLKPLYTEKLPASPRFPTIGEAAQRRRDFWMKTVARGGLGLMVAAPVLAFAYGTGVFPAGAFVAGLIIFAATCFISGLCKRT